MTEITSIVGLAIASRAPVCRRNPASFLSVCSGIEAASVAWEPLGWTACAFAEIEKFPSAVLAHHWPDVPNLGDLTKHHEWPNTLRPDIIVGGTPCQAFSVAGLRKGLADPRGNLTLVFLGLLERLRPRWVVWENVPGVLSDKTGAFGAFLGGLGQLGYGFAYRVLDAQYYGVAQKRRRVFVVGYLGDWRRAAAVLFEPESLRGDSPPRREKGERVAATITSGPPSGGPAHGQLSGHARETNLIPVIAPTIPARSLGGSGLGTDFDCDGGLIPEWIPVVSPTVTSKWSKGCGGPAGDEYQNIVALRGLGDYGDGLPSLRAKGGDCGGGSEALVAFSGRARGDDGRGYVREEQIFKDGIVGPIDTVKPHCIAIQAGATRADQIRRLTPRECERLQGFPDDFTLIPWRGKMAKDGPRYKALGNSMAVPVMSWIGERIQSIADISRH